jgi:hypothetical protein
MLKELNKNQLIEIAKSPKLREDCEQCAPLACQGWESVPSGFNIDVLKPLGTLRIDGAVESWDEYHPNGTNQWSANAPISPEYYPYNRCDVFECDSCKRTFLRYAEYGGYYVDERIRELNPNLIV